MLAEDQKALSRLPQAERDLLLKQADELAIKSRTPLGRVDEAFGRPPPREFGKDKPQPPRGGGAGGPEHLG